MSGVQRFPGRDPMCICPETTFTSGPTSEERAACRERSNGRLHRVLTADDMAKVIEAFHAIRPDQYGTSMHWPYCLGGGCTGCLPPPVLELEPVEIEPFVDPHRFDAVRAEAFRRVPEVR